MPSASYRLPKCIPIYQFDRCIPVKWRRSITNQLGFHQKGEAASFYAHLKSTGFLADTDESMVDCLLTVLQDFASRGHLFKAFRTFSFIQVQALARSSGNFLVDSLSFLLVSCGRYKLSPEGKQLHGQAITSGFDKHFALVPKLVSFYSELDLLEDAHFVTSNSNILHSLPWNILISSYAKKGRFQEAIFAFEEMCNKGIRPDHFTFPSVLKACAKQSNLDYGREVHSSIKLHSPSLTSNLFVQNALVSLYGKFGDLRTARSIFDDIPVKDDVSYNSMISGYVSMGYWPEAIELFEDMRAASIELNIVTWNTVSGAYLKTDDFEGALQSIRQLRSMVDHLDPVAVVNGLAACSEMCALKLGKEFHSLAIRSSAIDHDSVSNSLIKLYSRCQDLRHAFTVFRSIEVKSIIAWNSILSGFAQWDLSEESSSLFRQLLLAGGKPNHVTLAIILPLCARVANLRHGKELHCYMLHHEEFTRHLRLWNSLIEVYSRSGKVNMARKLFDLLDERDAVTYTSIITGYGLQGCGRVAVQLFEEMEKFQIKPDHVAMVAILSACSHSGLVAQGQHFFEKMQTFYGLTPNLEHYSCMADLFGRAGLLKKAKEIILRMKYKPTAEMYSTLIGACQINGNTEIGEWAAEKLLEMKSESPGHYVQIANMYAAAGLGSKVAQVRTFMRDLGVVKEPGWASVDLGDEFSPFVVEDTSKSEKEEIYAVLAGLAKLMKDVSSVAEEYFEVL